MVPYQCSTYQVGQLDRIVIILLLWVVAVPLPGGGYHNW